MIEDEDEDCFVDQSGYFSSQMNRLLRRSCEFLEKFSDAASRLLMKNVA